MPRPLLEPASQVQDLHQVFDPRSEQGMSHVILDGNLVACDRVACANGNDLWDSGKAKHFAGNVQFVATPDTICLGRNTYLGVPRPSIDASTVARSYWNVPMDGPAALRAPGVVSQLVVHGRYRKAEADRAAFEAETAEAHRD